MTTASTINITDATATPFLKQWKINQYRDHQVRIDFGGGVTQVRPILSNSYTILNFTDFNYATVTPWWNNTLLTTTSATAGSQSLYQIESSIITVNSNWTTNPDSTSHFVILSGGIWMSSVLAATPFISMQYYDVLADYWYQKTVQSNLLLAAPTDIAMDCIDEMGAALISGTATAGAARTLTNSGLSLTVNQYANFQLRITGGTGIGQYRTILNNTATIFTLTRNWDTTPDSTSTYSVFRPVKDIYLTPAVSSVLLDYNVDTDQWTTGKQIDYGTCLTAHAKNRSTGNWYCFYCPNNRRYFCFKRYTDRWRYRLFS